jgi:hypothetical protein
VAKVPSRKKRARKAIPVQPAAMKIKKPIRPPVTAAVGVSFLCRMLSTTPIKRKIMSRIYDKAYPFMN